MKLDIVQGKDLDNFGSLYGLERDSTNLNTSTFLETDEDYRERILHHLRKGNPPLVFRGNDEWVNIESESIKCECGKDKHNFAKHSEWCPKK